MLQKQTRGNSVNAELKLRYGSEASLTAKPAVASLTAAMLERGTKAHTYAQIRDAFDEGAARVYFCASGQAALQNFQVQRSQFRNLASIWAQYLTKPEGRTFAYDAELDRRIAALTPEQVSAAHKYLDCSNLTIVKANDFARQPKVTATAP